MIVKTSNLTPDAANDPYTYLLALDKDVQKIFTSLGQGVSQTVTLTGKTVQIINGLIVSPSGVI